MKKLIFTLSVLFASIIAANAQFTWHENFDPPTLGDSVTAYSSNPAPPPAGHNWDINTRLFKSSPNCDSAYLGNSDTLSLTTQVIDFTNMNYVLLSFDHICKIAFFDKAELYYSYDSTNWTLVDYTMYTGQAPFQLQLNSFSGASYADWYPGLPDTIPFDNTWWHHETFDLSPVAANIPTFWIKWQMYDVNSDITDTLNGWKLDNLFIQAAPCELIPPVVVQQSPIWNNIAYSLGPFITNVSDTDQSGILNSYLIYTINGVGPDTVVMTAPITFYDYTGDIPAVNAGDTVCYWFSVIDASGCFNTTTLPQHCFVASQGIDFPYCLETFDAAVLWSDTTINVGQSNWELGTPAFGQTTGAHSPPNAWDIDLTSGNLPNSDCYLYSPVFGTFTNSVNARLTFWQNRDLDQGDGVTLEYSNDGGATYQPLTVGATGGSAINWYTGNSFTTGQPIWDGNSGTWVKSDYIFGPTNIGGAQFLLRYRFTTDGFAAGAGISIDDFCFTLPTANDPGVSTIVSPVNSAPQGTCVDVIATIHNYGSNTLDSTNVYYSYNGTTFGPFTWTGSLPPGSEINDTLPCVVVDSGTFGLCVWVTLGADVNHTNDTVCTSVLGIPTIVISQGNVYCDDFNLPNSIWYNQLNTGGNAGTNWELGTPAFGTTNSAHTPPNSWDINLNSAYTNSADVSLYSPYFNIQSASNPYMTFWVNFNTEQSWDGVRLEYQLNSTGVWNLLNPATNTINWYNMQQINCSGQPAWAGNSAFVLQNPLPSGWAKVEANDLTVLGAGTNQTVQFRFVFCSDPSVTVDGFSIDDFCFAMPPPLDAGVTTIAPSGNAPANTCVPIDVTLKNFGTDTLTSFNVFYSLNGNVMGPYPWTGTLNPGATTAFSMPCDTIPVGNSNLCAWTDLTGDGNHYNDTTCTNIFGVPTVVIDSLAPYCDHFDTGTSLWFSQLNTGGNPGTNWELGTPGFGQTNSALSAPNAWDINLTSAYTNSADVSLYTPYFDISNAFNPYMSFWVNYNTEQNWDGVRLEYNVNGTGWNLLNPANGTVNWYSMPTINCSQQPAWAGTSTTLTGALGSGWAKVEANNLTILGAGTPNTFVQFRFTFCSDPSVTVDGFSIDDFCFAMPAPYDAGVTTILSPGFASAAGNCSPVQVTIKNFGYNTLTSTNVYYSKDDIPYGNPVTYGPYLWTGTLAPGASTTWILPVCDTVPSGAYNFCSWTQLVNPQVDGNFFNDTTCTQSVGVPILPISYTNSYCDNFDGPNVGWTVETLSPGSAWELGTPAFGATSTPFSPPNSWDVNLTTAYGNNANTKLYTPIFDFTQVTGTVGPVMSFYVNFNTWPANDGVRCEFRIGTGAWTTLFSPGFGIQNWYNSVACSNAAWSGNSSTALINANANGWAQVIDTLPTIPFNGAQEVQFRFDFCSLQFGFPTDGFSIDDFCMIVPVPLTAQPTTCHNTSNPPFIFPGQAISFDTYVRNAGTTPLTSVVTQLFINNGLIATDTVNYSPALSYNQSANHVFSNTWVTVPGVNNICMVTSYPNQGIDLNPTDDTLCCSISVIDTISVSSGNPYCPDFDNSPQWVTLNAFPPYTANSSWTFGQPNVGFMVGAKTGTNAWKVGPLNGNYPNKDSSALFTPAFNIQTGRTYKLSFWHEYDMEFYQDGGNVEYSTDFGGTWQLLGTGGTNTWYDSYFVTALGGTPPVPGWSLNSPVWVNPYHEICFQPQNGQLAYPVMFRFRFASDYSVNGLGWLIDDFCFEDIGVCPVGIEETSSASGLVLGQNRPNPTSSTTTIDYVLPKNGEVVLTIVNLMGQIIDTPVDEIQAPGMHSVNYNTNKLSPGIYYYSLTFNKETLVKKMVITK
jgi:hypothetical protein